MRHVHWKAASLDDKDIILTMMREYYEYDGLPFDKGKASRALEHLLKDAHFGEAILIIWQATPIGYVVLINTYSLEFGGVCQCVDEFFIKEPYRQSGAGKATIRFIEQLGVDSGITSLQLEVDSENLPAQKFYSKAGFKGYGRHLLFKVLSPSTDKSEESERKSSHM